MRKIKLFSILALALSFFVHDLHGEGIPESKLSNDEVRLLINRSSDSGGDRTNFAGWENDDPNSRLYIHIASPETECVYIGLGLSDLTDNGRDTYCDFDGEAIRYRLIAPNGVVVVDRTILLADLNITGVTDDLKFNNAATGPSEVTGMGYTAGADFTITPAIFADKGLSDEAGDYYIEFTEALSDGTPINPEDPDRDGVWDGFELEFFDFTVADCSGVTPIDKPGRVWSYRWEFTTTSPDIPFRGAFYVADEDEATAEPNDAFITKIDFEETGFQPYAFNLFFNSNGVQSTGDPVVDRQSLEGDFSLGTPEHRVFLNDPVDIYTDAEFSIPNVNVVFERCSDDPPFDYCFLVELDKPGSQLDILLDFNGIAGYQEGTADVIISRKVENGEAGEEVCIPWDGLDGLGAPVDPSTLDETNVFPTYFEGIFHFPIFDAERNFNSFNVTYIRPVPAGAEEILLKWDDSQITTAILGPCQKVNLDGCPLSSESCNRCWTNLGYGDRATLNTFWTSLTINLDFDITNTGYYTCDVTGVNQLCAGDATTLTANLTLLPLGAVPPDNLAFSWVGPDGPILGADDQSLNISDFDPATMAGEYTVTVSFGANCETSCSIILYADTDPPVLSGVPSDITVECDDIPMPATPSATDNWDPEPVITYEQTQSGSGCTYTLTRTWTATDYCGNAVSLSQTITVQDTQAPEFTSDPPADATVECDAVPTAPTLTAIDDCDGVVDVGFDEVRTDGDCPNNYTLTRTWTAVDECGNDVEHVQVLTVQDTKAPEFVGDLPEDATVECDAVPAAPTLTATDNCADAVVVDFDEVRTDGTCADSYTLTRTWTATDDCGNTAVHVQTLNVEDNQPPVFDDIPSFSSPVSCDNVPEAPEDVTATDNCSEATVKFTVDPYTVDPVNGYSITYRWTATDDCGNSTEATATLLVLPDIDPPAVVEEPGELEDIPCNGEFPPVEEIGYTDDCGTVEIVFEKIYEEDICNGYPVIYRWTLTDEAENETIIERTFNVLPDTEPPVFDEEPEPLPDIVAGTPLPEQQTLTASDNCSAVEVVPTVEIGEPVECGGPLCSFTQGFWGNAGGYFPSKAPENSTSGIIDELLATHDDMLVIGRPGASLTITTTECVLALLPSAGGPDRLAAGDDEADPASCETEYNRLHRSGRLPNNLATNVIALTLNIWYNEVRNGSNLGAYSLEDESLNIPDGVLEILSDPENGYDYTVQGLLDLANDYLGRLYGRNNSLAGDLTEAASSLNEYWGECSEAVGENDDEGDDQQGDEEGEGTEEGETEETAPCGSYTVTYRWVATDDCGYFDERTVSFLVLPGENTDDGANDDGGDNEEEGEEDNNGNGNGNGNGNNGNGNGKNAVIAGQPSNGYPGILQIIPNPVWNDFEIRFSAEREETVTIRLFSANGELMGVYRHDAMPGINRRTIETRNLSPGLYWVSVQEGRSLRIERFVKVRR